MSSAAAASSSSSSNLAADDDQDLSSVQYIKSVANEISDPEKLFNFIKMHLLALEECLGEVELKKKSIRALASWALQMFSKEPLFKSDARILYLWKLMAKYSQSLGVRGVWEGLHARGTFHRCAEFYGHWAEHWAAILQGDRAGFERIVGEAERNCQLTPGQSAKLFRPLRVEYYFNNEVENDGGGGGAEAQDEEAADFFSFSNSTLAAADATANTSSLNNAFAGLSSNNTSAMTANAAAGSSFFQEDLLVPSDEQNNSNLQPDPSAIVMGNNDDTTQQQEQQSTRTSVVELTLHLELWLKKSAKNMAIVSNSKEEAAATPTDNDDKAKNKENINDSTTNNDQQKQQQKKAKKQQLATPGSTSRAAILGHQQQLLSAFNCSNASTALFASPFRKRSRTTAGEQPTPTTTNAGPSASQFISLLDHQNEEKEGEIVIGSEEEEPVKCSSRNFNNQQQMCYIPNETQNVLADREQLRQNKDNNNNDDEDDAEEDIAKAYKEASELQLGNSHESEVEEEQVEETKNITLPMRQVEWWRLRPLEVPTFSFEPRQIPPTHAAHIHATAELWAEQPTNANANAANDESTHELESHRGDDQIRLGTVNPWDEQIRRRAIEAMDPKLLDCQSIPDENCPAIEEGQTVKLGGNNFLVHRFLGQGGFAHVYKAQRVHPHPPVAIKYESPACAWEVFICRELKRRVASEFASQSLMDVKTAILYRNASIIFYEFYPHGSLLDLRNMYKKRNADMDGRLATFFAIQLGRVLEAVHAAQLIHADVKPDNVMLAIDSFDLHTPLAQLLARPMLRLIDWGRSIDMRQFPAGQQFEGRANTKNFDCPEMIDGRPWTYQTDFYGFMATIFVLLKGDYLEPNTQPATAFKKRMVLYDFWVGVMDMLLHLPADCAHVQSPVVWPSLLERMEQELANNIASSPYDWRKTLERFNEYMKQRGMEQRQEKQQRQEEYF